MNIGMEKSIMAKRYWQLITGICLTASACSGGGQQAAVSRTTTETTAAVDNSQPDAKSGPSLNETLTFLDDSLKLEEGTFSGHGCEVATTQLSNIIWGVQEGPELKTEKDGSSKVVYGWHVYQQKPVMNGFSLKDIDPASIVSGGVFSIDFMKTHNVFDNPQAPRNADLTFVLFKTRNEKQDIRFGSVPDAPKDGDYVPFDQSTSSGRFFFHQQERAERFVTAFRHAVVLCGGKTSDFARTPGIR
jgi:hypothetical protein